MIIEGWSKQVIIEGCKMKQNACMSRHVIIKGNKCILVSSSICSTTDFPTFNYCNDLMAADDNNQHA